MLKLCFFWLWKCWNSWPTTKCFWICFKKWWTCWSCFTHVWNPQRLPRRIADVSSDGEVIEKEPDYSSLLKQVLTELHPNAGICMFHIKRWRVSSVLGDWLDNIRIHDMINRKYFSNRKYLSLTPGLLTRVRPSWCEKKKKKSQSFLSGLQESQEHEVGGRHSAKGMLLPECKQQKMWEE